jgi:hypothetical protein
MEITTTYDHQANLRIHTVKGDVNLEEFLAELKKIGREPKEIADMNSLWDLREADLAVFKQQHVEKIKNTVVHFWESSSSMKSALVVSRDVEFGLSRMYELKTSDEVPTDIITFRDYDKALEWLKKDSSVD